MILFDDVSYTFDDVEILKHINFRVKKGDFVAVYGKINSGKTTLIRLLLGKRELNSGSIKVMNLNIKDYEDNQELLYDKLAYMPEMIYLDDNLTALGNLVIANRNPKLPYLDALKMVGLEESAQRNIKNLNGLERRLLYLAIELLNNPEIIILDEPSGSLDIKRAQVIYDKISELHKLGYTVLVFTKNEYFLKYFKRTYILSNGKLA